jgi:hypothetical protein
MVLQQQMQLLNNAQTTQLIRKINTSTKLRTDLNTIEYNHLFSNLKQKFTEKTFSI